MWRRRKWGKFDAVGAGPRGGRKGKAVGGGDLGHSLRSGKGIVWSHTYTGTTNTAAVLTTHLEGGPLSRGEVDDTTVIVMFVQAPESYLRQYRPIQHEDGLVWILTTFPLIMSVYKKSSIYFLGNLYKGTGVPGVAVIPSRR